ncbi:phosphatase PAP2 family protein [Spirosoma validum]|uniref:Phosphatase PAP2 family protein n=1 Tax=Spirosoma validum TaxID=2771355 RepID=A0A927GF33_9BACT|nr:phosphatase PAP2 family protein [Spirosoma validum]MBD2755230.1 phosphatase PAP2 family protein [Spirosoma validum]
MRVLGGIPPKIFFRKSRVVIVAFFIYHSSFGQAPYQLHTGREVTLLGVGAVSLGASVVLSRTIDPLTSVEIATLNRADVNSFDQSATEHWSPTAAKLSHATLAGTIALAGGLAIGTKPIRQDLKTVAVMYVETMLLGNGIERTVKGITQRTRPFVYNPAVPLDEKLDRDARQSFFSGHATNAFASAVFASEVFRHYFPHSRLKPVVWVGSLGLATATAVLRYEGGKHYPTDLIAGAAFGSLVGWGIPKLHEVKNSGTIGCRLDIQPWSSGYANGIYVRLAVFSR